MVGRWFYLLAIGIGVFAYMNTREGGASASIEQTCDATGAVSVTMRWPHPEEGALETWVDLSLSKTFAPGAYGAHGPFEPSRAEFSLAEVPADIDYHYRVNTRYDDGWRATAEGSFTSACPPPVAGDAETRAAGV